jgi:hypothetical protein
MPSHAKESNTIREGGGPVPYTTELNEASTISTDQPDLFNEVVVGLMSEKGRATIHCIDVNEGRATLQDLLTYLGHSNSRSTGKTLLIGGISELKRLVSNMVHKRVLSATSTVDGKQELYGLTATGSQFANLIGRFPQLITWDTTHADPVKR